jgi:cytochrome c553
MKRFALTLSAVALLGAALAPQLLAEPKHHAAKPAKAPDDKQVVQTSDSDGIDAAKLWAVTCSRCHNARPAKTYSDAQWSVIMQHMRTRAYLTVPEARAITAFLQDGN